MIHLQTASIEPAQPLLVCGLLTWQAWPGWPAWGCP